MDKVPLEKKELKELLNKCWMTHDGIKALGVIDHNTSAASWTAWRAGSTAWASGMK
jgi:hypothetical protein